MKKTQLLFNKLKEIAVLENVENAFYNSGMENIFDYLDYGFFPLGKGILSKEHKSIQDIQENHVMVLGNDFGTKDYLIKQCPDRSEKQSNPTIKNLTTLLNLDLNNTFFTNINLGVRYEGTNIKRAKDLTEEYQKICFDFFVNQLNIINPKTIICLGHDVRKNLYQLNNYIIVKAKISNCK
jgi:uracil-DNA glycosylase family 4